MKKINLVNINKKLCQRAYNNSGPLNKSTLLSSRDNYYNLRYYSNQDYRWWRKNDQSKTIGRQEYFPHLSNFKFPKPSHFIFPTANGADKNWKACDYRVNHKISIPLFLYFEDLLNNKNDIYKRLSNYAGIYIWFNNNNHKYYIGSSTNLTERMTCYFSSIKNKQNKRIIDKAISKHGLDNFSLGIILPLQISNLDNQLKDIGGKLPFTLLDLEQKYIDLYKPKYNAIKAKVIAKK
jgi:hypothetical protein